MSAGSDEDGKVVRLRAMGRGPCPICGRPRAPDFRPFCSKRCADVDLGRWFMGGYRIASSELPDDEVDAEAGGEDEDEDEA